MRVIGHYLDMRTGKELPVVLARVVYIFSGEGAIDLKLDDSATVRVRYNKRDFTPTPGTGCLVAVEFYVSEGKVLPRIKAIGRHTNDKDEGLSALVRVTHTN